MYAQEKYAKRDDRLHVRTNREVKRLLKDYCDRNGEDMSDVLNNTLIWAMCKKKIIDLPYKKPEEQKLSDWYSETSILPKRYR